ncbi:hypothetical protein Vafri_2536 [Volvox africanus]|uniref:Uncharacterized protein n=1 Tax=Volvox africanus TaxID=51714 RepID=A0A8J4ASG2_9CHLO|nr:hypothetical protein Vafri_2536 [Volvox africanus]
MAESQRAKTLLRKVNLNGPQTDASKREPTNRSQMPVQFIDLEEIQRELPTGVPVLIDQEAVVLNVHWPAESNTADIHAQLYGPLAAAILKTIYESLLLAEPELSYSPKIGNHHQYKHRNGTVIQEIHVLVPKGGLAKLNSSFTVQQGHLKLGLISLLPNSPPIDVEVHIRNLHKAAPVYWEITGVPPNLAPQAVPSFHSSARNEWLKRDFQQLNPTKMANTWRVKMAPGSHSLPHETPYSLRGSNNHRLLVATKIRMVEEEVPFTMPCPPRHAWSSSASVTYNVNNNAKCSSYNSNISGKSNTSNNRGGNNSSNHSSNTALTLRVPTVTNANNPPSLLPGQPTKVMPATGPTRHNQQEPTTAPPTEGLTGEVLYDRSFGVDASKSSDSIRRLSI